MSKLDVYKMLEYNILECKGNTPYDVAVIGDNNETLGIFNSSDDIELKVVDLDLYNVLSYRLDKTLRYLLSTANEIYFMSYDYLDDKFLLVNLFDTENKIMSNDIMYEYPREIMTKIGKSTEFNFYTYEFYVHYSRSEGNIDNGGLIAYNKKLYSVDMFLNTCIVNRMFLRSIVQFHGERDIYIDVFQSLYKCKGIPKFNKAELELSFYTFAGHNESYENPDVIITTNECIYDKNANELSKIALKKLGHQDSSSVIKGIEQQTQIKREIVARGNIVYIVSFNKLTGIHDVDYAYNNETHQVGYILNITSDEIVIEWEDNTVDILPNTDKFILTTHHKVTRSRYKLEKTPYNSMRELFLARGSNVDNTFFNELKQRPI